MGKPKRSPHHQAGNTETAQSGLAKAVSLHQRGDPQGALREYLRYLKHCPGDAEALHAAGGLHYQLGETGEAIRLLKKASDAAPGNADYLNDLGGLYLSEGRNAESESCFRQALRLRPDYVQVRTNLGHALFRAGKLDEAIGCFREVIERKPDFADAHYNLGVALEQNGQLELAVAAYESAIRLRPELAVAHFNLGQVSLRLGRNEIAVGSFRAALRHSPGYVNAMLGLGEALKEAWRVEEGIQWLREYLKHQPDSIAGHLQLGNALELAGDLEGAQTIFRKAIAVTPQSAAAWYGLASAKRFSADDDPDIAAMEGLLEVESLTEEAQCTLHFALGKVHDDRKEFDLAFQHYQAANDMKRKGLPEFRQNSSRRIDQIIEVFAPEFFERHRDVGSESNLPVFILGMPRSGTTLTEQIISSHPDVNGGGELSYFGSVTAGMHVLLKTPERYPLCCESLEASNFSLITEPYLKLLRWHSSTARHVTDKMPGNFHYLGLIALLFPRAAIIHCERDPMDTCLSIYFQSFAKGHDYSHDLREIGETYKQYQRLMRHWQEVLPGRFYASHYEELVSNPEEKARELIAACDLPWDDRCLSFHQNKREVRTASVAQVRQPIYTRSKQRWRNYEKHLGALKEALGYREE